MDISLLQQQSETRWIMPPTGHMRTPAILYASPELIHAMDAKVLEQLTNIAALLACQVKRRSAALKRALAPTSKYS